MLDETTISIISHINGCFRVQERIEKMIRSYFLQCLDFETTKPVLRMRASFGWLRKQQPAGIAGLPVLKTEPSRGDFASNKLGKSYPHFWS